ncbi:MAG: hypothetical protein ABI402_08945 [Ferruginibacter sp.]
MPAKKESIVNQEADSKNVKKEIHSRIEEFIPDKLIGDDLDIQKAGDHEDPEMDSSRDLLDK